MTLKQLWMAAVSSIRIRHIDPTCEPEFQVIGGEDAPSLFIVVRQARDTRDQEKRFGELVISTVRLNYWPGTALAHAWLSAGWAGYMLHEALELSTVMGDTVLDPHKPPYQYDRGLRCGYPVDLTPETLETTLAIVMDPVIAAGLVRAGGAHEHRSL